MLKDKAHENLAAGDLLLARGHVNAATSRYYYAMYQAAVHRLAARGFRPGEVRSGAIDWDHSMVMNNLRRLGGRWPERLLYTQMRHLRGQADYADEAVATAEVEGRAGSIGEFVRRLVE